MKPWLVILLIFVCFESLVPAYVIPLTIKGNLTRDGGRYPGVTNDWDNSVQLPYYTGSALPYIYSIKLESTTPRVDSPNSDNPTAKMSTSQWNLGPGVTGQLTVGDYLLSVTDMTVRVVKYKDLSVGDISIVSHGVLPSGHKFRCIVGLKLELSARQLVLSDIIKATLDDYESRIWIVEDHYEMGLNGTIDSFNFNGPTVAELAPSVIHAKSKVSHKASDAFAISPHYASGTLTPSAYGFPTIGSNLVIDPSVTGALVSIDVNPNGFNASYYFEYGLTTNYGLRTPLETVGNGNSAVSVQTELAGLRPNTLYHFRIVVVSVAGTFYGEDETFTTLPDNSFD